MDRTILVGERRNRKTPHHKRAMLLGTEMGKARVAIMGMVFPKEKMVDSSIVKIIPKERGIRVMTIK